MVTADTISVLETLRDMKNLRHKEVVSKRKKPEKEVDNFDPTKYGEASEKTHSASNQTQLGLNGHLKTTFISIALMCIKDSFC